MKKTTIRRLRRIGLVVAIGLLVIGAVAWYWLIPAAIVAAIQDRHEGHVAISGWWVNGSSAGVTGLTLHEDPAPGSPTWAAVDRVATDLSIGALIRGRFTPRRIVFDRASIAYRIDADGTPLTRIPIKQSGQGEIPELIVRDGTLAMRQERRPELVVHHLGATLGPDPEGPRFEVKADDPEWGHPGISGRFAADFSGFRFRLTADRLPTDPEKARRIPFVDEDVWKYVEPRGPVGVVLDFDGLTAKAGPDGHAAPIAVATTAIFQGTTVNLPTLGLVGEEVTGRLTVRDKIVELQDVRGRMCDGRVAFSGPIDFLHQPDRYDLALTLDGVDLTALPESWQLHRMGVRGRFTGMAALRLALRPDGLDLTGSTGDGTIDGAEVSGIPLRRLGLTLRGEGLRSTKDLARSRPGEASREGEAPAEPPGDPARRVARPPDVEVARPPDVEVARREARPPGSSGGQGGKEGPFLPQWIGADFRVEQVELERAIARVQTPDRQGSPRQVPVSGRLDLDARMRLPLGALDDLAAYEGHGSADVAGATIGGLDVGRVRAQLDASGGILQVTGLRGRLVDRPAGGGRPAATEPPPAEGPLPRGGFRGRVRAELVGERGLDVEMEGVELPIAELLNVSPEMMPPSAPPTPRGLPVEGRITVRASAHAKGSDSWDPRTWTLSGRARMPQVSYRTTVAKDVSGDLSINGGQLVFSGISGRLGDASFQGRVGIGLAEPWSYQAELDTGDLSCRELIGFVPHVSETFRSQVEGTIAGRGEAKGTLRPWRVDSIGNARVGGLKVARVLIGDVPVRWATQGDTIAFTADEHQRYGGRLSAEARVPVSGGRPIEGTFNLAKVDAAALSAEAGLGESWELTGRADGRGWFRYSPGAPGNGASLPVEGEGHLTAPDLKVGGVPARSVKLALTVHEGNPRFEVAAEGLGGSLHVTGDGHLAADSKDNEVRAQVDALALRLYEVWGALGTSGPLADLRGRATIKGRIQARGKLDADHIRGEGSVEGSELIWGYDYRLGSKLLTGASKSADGWRVGPLGGDLFGGKVSGDGVWMYREATGRARYGVDARIDRLLLARALSFLPEADRRFGGTAVLRVTGRPDGALGGSGEIRVDRGFINGLEMTDLRIPGEWTFSPDAPRRGALHITRADGRLASGRVGGEAHFVLGDRRDFRARLLVDDVDLRVISRDELASRAVPGRLSGVVNVYGTDPANPSTYRGDLTFDLDQASLIDIPLLDELDRALGSIQGGVFDDGDIHGTIADRKLHIDELTLVGPLAQVRAVGTLDFDGRLNLEVVVNNNRGIPQSGQVMLARSPRVADEVARRASQIDQVRDFVSSRLMKFRITGTIRDPIANVDRSINPRAAIGFFLKTMRLSAQSR